MTGTLHIPEGEYGHIRVFAVNLPEAEVKAMMRQTDGGTSTAPGDLPRTPAAATLLGWPDLDTRHAEIFSTRDLSGLGLTGYLTEGLGLDEAQLAPDRARLSALDGYVLILLSRAFGNQAQTLTVPPDLTLIGTYKEAAAPVSFEPLTSNAAQGTLSGPAAKPSGDQAWRLLRVAALTALILLLLAIGLVAFLGGGGE